MDFTKDLTREEMCRAIQVKITDLFFSGENNELLCDVWNLLNPWCAYTNSGDDMFYRDNS